MSQDFKPLFEYFDKMKAELKAGIISELEAKIDKLETSINNLVPYFQQK